LAYHSLEVQAKARLEENRSRIAEVSVELDAARIEWDRTAAGKHRAGITVVVAAFSPKGTVVAHTGKKIEVLVGTRKYTEFLKRGMVIRMRAEVPPAAVRMRVVARDSTNGNIGTADLTPEGVQFH
jgi:hypothetical protein